MLSCHALFWDAGVPPRRSRRATAELRAAPSLEALMQLLVARAKLLLSLRSVVQAQRQEQVRPNLLIVQLLSVRCGADTQVTRAV